MNSGQNTSPSAETPSQDAAWARRSEWISELSRSDGDFLDKLWSAAQLEPKHEILRAPEVGLVMTRGRAGGEGAPFNLGEVTAVRCAVKLGEVEGHSYALGRNTRKAHIAALCDALMQTDQRSRIETEILGPLRDARLAHERMTAEKAAATRVEFFTMTRGEN